MSAVYYIDELILREIRNRNERVLFDLYKTHYPAIQRLVLANSGSEQEAKDIYQEGMIAFYERACQPDFALTCRIGTYLYAVCRRLWLKRLAEKKLTPMRIDDAESFLITDEEFDKVEDEVRYTKGMERSLTELGQPCSDIIVDFYYNSLSMDDITAKYGYTNSDNAKNQKYKCLQRLKKLFFSQLKMK